MKILDVVDKALQKEKCSACGKPKNGVLRGKGDVKSTGYRGNSHYAYNRYATKIEAKLCMCRSNRN